MASMSEHEKRIREARLLVSPPEIVFEELTSYGEKAVDDFGTGDKELEKNLLARDEHLINLALAQYGTDRDILGELYRRGLGGPTSPLDARYRQGLRIAVLSNRATHEFWGFPKAVIGEEEIQRVVVDADRSEAEALLRNPNTSEELMVALYERRDPFSAVSDDRWCDLVAMSAANPRLDEPNDTQDGPDLRYRNIQEAIFRFLSIAPTTPKGLHTAYRLLENLNSRHLFLPKQIDAELIRWANVQVLNHKNEPSEGYFTPMGLVDEFRCMLAALYGRALEKEGYRVHGSPKSTDIAARCAYYGKANLDEKAMRAGYTKDNGTFVFAALYNDHVFFTAKLRELLEEECLAGGLIGRYRRRCEQLQKQWRDFDPKPQAEWLRDGEVEDPNKADKSVRRLLLIDRKLNYFAGVLSSLVTIAVWVAVFYLISEPP